MINAFYKKYQKHFDVSENNFAHFVMWSCGGICIGFVIGLVGIAFHLALEWATEFRTAHPMLLWLLPFGRSGRLCLPTVWQGRRRTEERILFWLRCVQMKL